MGAIFIVDIFSIWDKRVRRLLCGVYSICCRKEEKITNKFLQQYLYLPNEQFWRRKKKQKQDQIADEI